MTTDFSKLDDLERDLRIAQGNQITDHVILELYRWWSWEAYGSVFIEPTESAVMLFAEWVDALPTAWGRRRADQDQVLHYYKKRRRGRRWTRRSG